MIDIYELTGPGRPSGKKRTDRQNPKVEVTLQLSLPIELMIFEPMSQPDEETDRI